MPEYPDELKIKENYRYGVVFHRCQFFAGDNWRWSDDVPEYDSGPTDEIPAPTLVLKRCVVITDDEYEKLLKRPKTDVLSMNIYQLSCGVLGFLIGMMITCLMVVS